MFYLHTEVVPGNRNHTLKHAARFALSVISESSANGFNYLKSSVFTGTTGTLLLMHEKMQSWLNLFGLLIIFELKFPIGSDRKPK